MKTDAFIKRVAQQYAENITDNVFLMIQADRELHDIWIKMTEKERNNANRTIGKKIKKIFNLRNKDVNARNKEPQSVLIKSFQKLETK